MATFNIPVTIPDAKMTKAQEYIFYGAKRPRPEPILNEDGEPTGEYEPAINDLEFLELIVKLYLRSRYKNGKIALAAQAIADDSHIIE